MEVIDIPLTKLKESHWSPNTMTPEMRAKLRESIRRYGIVENLTVRPLGDEYEVLSGNQRLKVYGELGLEAAPCVLVHLNDSQARLLTQVLNRTREEDDLGLKAALVKELLETLSREDVMALLPETASSLQALASLGQESMAQYLSDWERVQAARLRHLQFQLLPAQLEVVEEALEHILPQARQAQGESPNVRGTALYLLCKGFLAQEEKL